MLSKTLVVFLVVSCVSDFSHGQKYKKFFRKDYTYFDSTEAFYKVHTLPTTWLEAKKQCEMEGSFLFYPKNEREAHVVISFWTSSEPFEWVYVGISDLVVAKGVFVTIDGIPISNVFHNWAPGEPNDAGGNEDCVEMNKDAQYNDVSCDQKLSFICKKTLQSLQWNQDCNLPDLDYRLNEGLGKCYKLHTTPLSWVEAYATCAAEQSYLSVVNSPTEAKYLVDLAKTAPSDHNGNYLTGAIHSGFHNRYQDGWQTIKGVPLSDCGYTNWDDNQPDGEAGAQCGSLFYNQRLHAITCDTKSLFICEYDVHMNKLGIESSTPAY